MHFNNYESAILTSPDGRHTSTGNESTLVTRTSAAMKSWVKRPYNSNPFNDNVGSSFDATVVASTAPSGDITPDEFN